MKIERNIVSYTFFLILALITWILIPTQIAIVATRASGMNASTVPKLVVITAFILSAIGLVQSVIKFSKGNGSFLYIKPSEEFRVALLFLLLVVYAITMPTVGFIVGSTVICMLALVIMQVKKPYYYAISLATVIIVYSIFKYLLNISLPNLNGII